MKVLFDGTSDYPEGPIQSIEFKELENSKPDLLFCYGIHPGYRMVRPSGFKYNIYFESEEPNGFVMGQMPHQRGNWDINFWTKIINCCPYSAQWENHIYDTDKFVYDPYIINPKYAMNEEKIYSVCYIGGLNGRVFHQIVDIIKDIPGYRFVSLGNFPYVTNRGVGRIQKLKLNSQSKISICVNLLSENIPGQYAQNISKIPDWRNNEAFKKIETGIMPQFKVRVLEAGLTHSLLLVMKDPWNVIEHSFIPNEHFIYFDSLNNLKEVINLCLSEWDHCKKIIDNMYHQCMNYHSIQAFYDKHLKEYDT